VVVEQGRISKAYYDEINEDGQLKSFDQDYLERWKERSEKTFYRPDRN